MTRAGVNFADTHTRTNSYVRKATLPLVPGGEVAGVREDTGERVIALTGTGGYAQYAAAPAEHVFAIPEGVEDGTALALLVQGTTAWHMYRTAGRVGECPREGVSGTGAGGSERGASEEEEAGETVVVHAAAGGVGSLAVQLGRPLGAGRVIATASSEEKRALALELGADVAIDPAPEGLTERLLEANGGRAVDVVFEMAGGEVFDASYARAGPVRAARGVRDRLAAAQPDLERFAPAPLAGGGGLLHLPLPRPPGDVHAKPWSDLFARVERGELRVVVGHTYALGGGPAGAYRPARAAHDGQAAARPGRLSGHLRRASAALAPAPEGPTT